MNQPVELFRPKFFGALIIDGTRHDYWEGCSEPSDLIRIVEQDARLTYYGHGGLDTIIVEIHAMKDGVSDCGLVGTSVPLMTIIRNPACFDVDEYDTTTTVEAW